MIPDKEAHEELKKTVCRRLRVARRAAGVSESEAAEALAHKNPTQISLMESGDRMPPMLTIMKLCDLYCVPMDWVTGRIDDPIAEPQENNQGLVVRMVHKSLVDLFGKFATAVGQHTSVCISNHREDRQDIHLMLKQAEEVKAALLRVKELNPEYEDDCRGASRLEGAVDNLLKMAQRVEERIRREVKEMEVIDKALELERVELNIKQFNLELQM